MTKITELSDDLILCIMGFMPAAHTVLTGPVNSRQVRMTAELIKNIEPVNKQFRELWKERLTHFTVVERKQFLVSGLGFRQALRFCEENDDKKVLEHLKKSGCYAPPPPRR